MMEKERLKRKLESLLSLESLIKAKHDLHAKRGHSADRIPVLSGEHCPNACSYCYTQSMGHEFKQPTLWPLNGLEMCYALLTNREFIPGILGTFIAMGHISEPFLPQLKDKTLEYIDAISTYLHNPIQFSSKSYINSSLAKEIKKKSNGAPISPLITITTIKYYKKVEPNVPSPEKRFESIANLAEVGFKPCLFLRPLLSGIVEDDLYNLLEKAKQYGASGVVIGGLRIDKKILLRMKSYGINTQEIEKRIENIGDKMKYINVKDLEEKAIQTANKLKLVPFISSLCALAYCYKVPCTSLYWINNLNICTKCPNKCWEKVETLIRINPKDIIFNITGVKLLKITINDMKVECYITAKNMRDIINKKGWKIRVLETMLRRKIKFIKV